MSILDQINRLTAAKSSIVTSISNKGVTVPTGVKMEGMSALIDTIVPQENLDAVMEQQDTAITEQDTLIASIQAALEGKALGSGGSVETCTVTLYTDGSPEVSAYYSDGTSEYKQVIFGDLYDTSTVTIDVLKHSIILPYASNISIQTGDSVQIGNAPRNGIFITGDATIYMSY